MNPDQKDLRGRVSKLLKNAPCPDDASGEGKYCFCDGYDVCPGTLNAVLSLIREARIDAMKEARGAVDEERNKSGDNDDSESAYSRGKYQGRLAAASALDHLITLEEGKK